MAKKQKKSAPTASKAKTVGVKPLGDRVLVRPESAKEEKSPGGFIIPDTAKQEKPERGVVVAVGEGKRNEKGDVLPLRVNVGDTVIFSKYGYDEVKMGDEEYYIVSENNILAVVK